MTTITPEAKAILRDVQGCAMGWEPDVRLLGNSRADECACTLQDCWEYAARRAADEVQS